MDNNNNMNENNNSVNPMFTQPENIGNPDIPVYSEPVSLNKEAAAPTGDPINLSKEPTPDFNQNPGFDNANTAQNNNFDYNNNTQNNSFDYTQTAQNSNNYTMENSHDHDTAAIVMLVLGILSIFCCWPSGVAAIIMWVTLKGKFSQEKEGIAKGGFICGCIGVGIWIAGILLNIIVSLLSGGVSLLALMMESMG